MNRCVNRKRFILIAAIAGLLLASSLSAYAEDSAAPDCGTVNLAHLEHLQKIVMLNGEEVRVVQIYSEAPDYHLVGDSDEGFTCVDDVARAARLYMLLYQQKKNPDDLVRAKGMLAFVMGMQAQDGEFYNFLLPGPVINTTHQTSVKSIDWWSARAFRAIAEGYGVYREVDPDFAARLSTAVRRTLHRLSNYDPSVGNGEYELGYDASAEMLSGLAAWYRETKDDSMLPTLNRFADWVMNGTRQPTPEFPFTVHKPWRNLWHGWGQAQVEALANAGALLNRQDWIESAKAEAEGWQPWLLIEGGFNYLEFNDTGYENEKKYPQIAYDYSSMVQANAALFTVTGDTAFAWISLLAGSWFCGDNLAGVAMYDAATGRGYDGIVGPDEVNWNSGAESTIEALMAMARLNDLPVNRKVLAVRLREKSGFNSAVFAGGGWKITLQLKGSKYSIDVMHDRE